MQPQGEKINNLHLAFLIMGYTFGTAIIFPPGTGASKDAWLVGLSGLITGLLWGFIFFALAEKFPGKNLIDINDCLFGNYLGKFISILYLGYFLHLGSLVLGNFGDFLTVSIYLQTPKIVFIILIALLAASAVRNGIEVIARCSLILVPITILFIAMDTIFLLPQADFGRMLPLFQLPLKEFIKLSHTHASLPYGEVVTFLMITGSLNNSKGLKKYALHSLLISGIILVGISVRNIAILGITAQLGLYPSYDVIQLISIGDVLTRLELVIIIVMLTMGFIKITVLYYSTVQGMAQLLKIRSYLPLVLPTGIIMVVISGTQFETAQELNVWATNIYPLYTLPFHFFFPLLSLTLATIKGNKGSNKRAGERA